MENEWSSQLVKNEINSKNVTSIADDLWNAMKLNNTKTLTENNAVTYSTSNSKILDFFAMGGALRKRNNEQIEKMISQALGEDFLLGVKCLFHIRDIREGQGERRTFRIGLKVLSENYPEETLKLLPLIAHYGRFDDILSVENINIKDYILSELNKDNSLIFKWMPSCNAGNKSKLKAKALRKYLGLKEVEYRKMLSKGRKKLDLVETKMTEKKYNEIDYSKVPSKANLFHHKSFYKHDADRYKKYLESVVKGENKINTKTLYPYEIVAKVNKQNDETLEVLWRMLPDYTNNENAIVVADVSGSMRGRPLDVSTSLALYFAERNEGLFHNKFITFSERPELQEIIGNNLHQKILNLENAHWEMNTNLQAVFDLILNTAVKNKIAEDEMPRTIYIISDMEFDEANRSNTSTNFENIKVNYKKNGYDLPQIVFWNVDSRNNNLPVKENEDGVLLISGSSPIVFKTVMDKCKPIDYMNKVLNSKRYEIIEKTLCSTTS
jgi:hypothetical protein